MGREGEFQPLADAENQYETETKSSPILIGYAVGVTLLFITAGVLLGIVYFSGDDDDAVSDRTIGSPLIDFVYAEDPAFKFDSNYDPITTHEGYTLYSMNLTSGTWLTPTDSSTYVQWHWLQLCVPDDVEDTSFAFLWIGGGRNTGNDPPSDANSEVIAACLGTKTLTFGLKQVPNQPMTFQGDPTEQSRTEDAVIAWTWAHFINNTLETDWLARMPMTRAGVRAMDAGQQFWDTIRGEQKPIEKFVVGGASKRGWTSWMVGSMGDDRVVGIMPVVAPIANITPQMDEQYKSYGYWSWVLRDYYSLNLMHWLFTPTFEEMQYIIDPLSYQPEMKRVKKLQIGGTNDEFFQPDALKWYWDGIPGQKNYRIVAGANHGLQIAGNPTSAQEVLGAAFPFLLSFKDGYDIDLPSYSWDISEDGETLTVYCSTKNLVEDEVVVWVSENKANRDWRQYTCDPSEGGLACVNTDATWTAVNATKEKDGVYSYTIETPMENMYSAFLIELSYDLVEDQSHYLVSTDVSIVPVDQFAYPACSDCDCGWDCPTTATTRETTEKPMVYDKRIFF